jgi:hypothetical protein
MLHILCPESLEQAYLECGCPEGHVEANGSHHETCALADIYGQLPCSAPGTGTCCEKDHDHQVAAECPGGHTDPCPEPPGKCRLWNGLKQHVKGREDELTADQRAELRGECPGGHCHKDVPGCNVCHPIIITVPAASGTALKPAGA